MTVSMDIHKFSILQRTQELEHLIIGSAIFRGFLYLQSTLPLEHLVTVSMNIY